MVKSGSICGNPIKLFLSSRSEMQSVIALARANPPGKTLPTVTEQTYEQQDQNGANLPKIPSAAALSSILAEMQARSAHQQQQQLQMQQPQPQQQPAMIDPTNTLLLAAAAAQNGSNPLVLQQLLAALNEKQQQQQQQQMSFQMPVISNPINQFPQQTNGWMPQQVIARTTFGEEFPLIDSFSIPMLFNNNSNVWLLLLFFFNNNNNNQLVYSAILIKTIMPIIFRIFPFKLRSLLMNPTSVFEIFPLLIPITILNYYFPNTNSIFPI